ncbi:MAG: HalOD1 output domain-containing protein [Methanobacteriota archaeon]
MNSKSSVIRFDPKTTRSALDAVFTAVSEFKNTDAKELRRLDEFVDPDTINLLFGGPGRSTTRIKEGTLSFRYDDVFVTVTHDGWIRVVDADAFRARSPHRGVSVDTRAQQSTEAALEAAAAAFAEAEEHVWTAASNTSDTELVDPLWAVVERLWAIQTSIDDLTAQSSSTEPLATQTDDQP